ncbi:MAG: phage terminase large subunit, partial [Candidatus Nanopelagicales bacterium]
EQYKPVKWGEEGGQIIKSLGPFIAERMKERRVYCVREQFTSSRDKGTRARSIQGRMSMGKVLFPKHKPWTGELVSELLKFPQGKHDDQVDVLSLFGRMLESFYGRGPSMAPRVASDGQRILDSLTEEKRVGRYG